MIKNKTLNNFFNLWKIISESNKLFIKKVVIFFIFTGLIDNLALLSSIPFLRVLIEGDEFIKNNLYFFGIQISLNQYSEYILFTSFLFGFLSILAISIRLFSLRLILKVAANLGHDLSQKIYFTSLNQPYELSKSTHTSNFISTLTVQVTVVADGIKILLQSISNLILIIAIYLGLLISEPQITLNLSALLIFGYFLSFLITKKLISGLSKKMSESNMKRIKLVQEGLYSIKDIILDSSQKYFLNSFKKYDWILREATSRSEYAGQFPKFFIEGFALFLVLLIIIFSIIQGQNNKILFTQIGLFLIALQRILPAMQFVYASLTTIKARDQDYKDVYFYARNYKNYNKTKKSQINIYSEGFNKIEFRNVSFKYKNRKNFALEGVNLIIKKGDTIGIIGKTGSGKSTFIDLFMGLLDPTEGSILINNKILDYRGLKSWQSRITHIPQNIYLMDTSIQDNILFGVEKEKINLKLLDKCINISQLESTINNSKQGLNLNVGEGGSSLSGGQKQRVGIARALYKNREILVMDEATNSLDKKTEEKILKKITEDKNITKLIVSHNEDNLKFCNVVFKINDGEVILKE